MYIFNRVFSIGLLVLLVACSGSSGGGGGSDGNVEIDPIPPVPDNPESQAFELQIKNYSGSLYNSFDWSGPIRDPMRDVVEIPSSDAFFPMSSAELSEFQEIVDARKVIMQIGGLGSAKLNRDEEGRVVEGIPNPNFVAYMEDIEADQAASWKAAVAERAREILSVSPEGSGGDFPYYWQIGNEINARSYSVNIHLYLEDGLPDQASDLDVIPFYVENFFAPTVSALLNVSEEENQTIPVALGSIAGLHASSAKTFLETLLNYEITGTYAPELAGTPVYELVDLLTGHYFMNASSPEDPTLWQDTLLDFHNNWVGKGRIKALWNTEDLGSSAADKGLGAVSAARILVRGLDWANTIEASRDDFSWFYYAPKVGPAEQTADAMLGRIDEHMGNEALILEAHQYDNNDQIESYVYRHQDSARRFITVSGFNNSGLVSLSSLQLMLDSLYPVTSSQAWLYSAVGTEPVEPTVEFINGELTVVLNPAIGFSQDVLLLILLD